MTIHDFIRQVLSAQQEAFEEECAEAIWLTSNLGRLVIVLDGWPERVVDGILQDRRSLACLLLPYEELT